MKSNSLETSSIIEILKKIPLQKLSKESQFSKRKTKKITAREFLVGFYLMIYSPGQNSYQQWANKISLLKGKLISKQALWKRIQPNVLVFLKNVLSCLSSITIDNHSPFLKSKKLKQFSNIIIEDGTHFKVSEKLSEAYPGSRYGGQKKDNAIVKLQVAYNLTKGRYERIFITNFRKNDQGYAGEILSIVSPGDLLLRDLGYFALKLFRALQEKGVYFISRLRNHTNLYISEHDDNPIDLATMLRKRGKVDISVFIGLEERLPVRLVALPVETSVASERRRKAKSSRQKGTVLSKEKLFLLGWEIFITNVEADVLSSEDIAKVYFFRWRIEVLFKCWKSHLKLDQPPIDANQIRLEAYIYAMLILITLIHVGVYRYYIITSAKPKNDMVSKKEISLVKLTGFIADNIQDIIFSAYQKVIFRKSLIHKRINYYCCYECRHDRLNFIQKLALLG